MPLDSIGYRSPVGYVETKIVDADGEVLRRAADYIESNGLARAPSASLPATCVRGAIVIAMGYDLICSVPREYYDLHQERIEGRLGVGDAPRWNDQPGRTKEEVIARLRSAAEQGAS
jgi:hypothetical protein